jgi:hypothetical protein
VFALFHSLALSRASAAGDFRERQQHDNELLNRTLADLMAPDAAQLAYAPEDAANLLRTLTFAITHPILSDQRHSEPKEIVDIVLHGITTRPHAQGEHAC